MNRALDHSKPSTSAKGSPETTGGDQLEFPVPKARIAPDSIWTMEDQLNWYREQKGDAAVARQMYAARIARGQCVCDHPLREVGEKQKQRLHRTHCPKHKTWMDEFLPPGKVVPNEADRTEVQPEADET